MTQSSLSYRSITSHDNDFLVRSSNYCPLFNHIHFFYIQSEREEEKRKETPTLSDDNLIVVNIMKMKQMTIKE
jgi:hypothetical protein